MVLFEGRKSGDAYRNAVGGGWDFQELIYAITAGFDRPGESGGRVREGYVGSRNERTFGIRNSPAQRGSRGLGENQGREGDHTDEGECNGSQSKVHRTLPCRTGRVFAQELTSTGDPGDFMGANCATSPPKPSSKISASYRVVKRLNTQLWRPSSKSWKFIQADGRGSQPAKSPRDSIPAYSGVRDFPECQGKPSAQPQKKRIARRQRLRGFAPIRLET